MLLAACARQDQATIEASAARAAIVAQINLGIDATRNKNADGYIDQIPDEIVMRDAQGEVLSRDSLRARVLRAWAMIERTRALDAVVDTVILHGDSATVVTTMRWDRLVRGTDGKSIDTMLSVRKQSETWRRTPKGWRAFNVTPLGGVTTMNGKSIPQQ